MSYIIAKDRAQMSFGTLSDGIEQENPVRFIEAFLDKIDLHQLGFQPKKVKEEGRPSFDPKILMKLYLYGYLNGVRKQLKAGKRMSLMILSRQNAVGKSFFFSKCFNN
jgi:transposase